MHGLEAEVEKLLDLHFGALVEPVTSGKEKSHESGNGESGD